MSENQAFDRDDDLESWQSDSDDSGDVTNEEMLPEYPDTLVDESLDMPASTIDDAVASPASGSVTDLASVSEQERLRQPRAQNFRRRLRNQLSFLPTAIYLVVIGVFLIGRKEGVEGWPNYSDLTLVVAGILVVGFSAILHALFFGRRERGLLFVGLFVWVTAGTIGALITLVEEEPDFAEWWPILLAALGITLLLTYLIERLHDVRLILVGVLVMVAAITSYIVTSGSLTEDWVTDAGDYWPLLFAVLGIGILPLVFRRRTG